ncbi:MAG: alpha-ketoacid dehydrogenase subunit beta [Deltaproteobacteria bacterium]|nr:alpha-ketoacid dehydrogenase subunit beta [Deltaproteobacteria bacterium]
MAKRNLVSAINLALDQEMARNDRIVLLGEDVGREGGVFRVTEGLQEKYGETRVVDTPLAEAAIVGAALGLALGGMLPVPEIQFEGFLYPALNQLCNHIARYRTRTRGTRPVRLVLRCPWGGGIHAPEHHSDSPETLLVHTPGLTVVTPSNPYDAKGLMTAALRHPDPVVYCEPKRIYRAVKGEVPEEEYTVPIGVAQVVRPGADATVVAWGALVREAMAAAETLEGEGIGVEVIDLRTLAPMDSDTVVASVRKTGRLVVAHEAPRTLGLGAELSARVTEEALTALLAPVERVTGYDTVMPLYRLENHYLPDAARIERGVRKVMAY